MPPERKLKDVFNAYADKIVEGREFEKLFRRAVKKSFTSDELKEFNGLRAPKGDPDVTGGVYVSDHSVYFSGAFLQRNTPEGHIPAALTGKVAAAFEDAFRGARDHRAAVKSGKLKPLPPGPGGFGF